MVQHMSTTPEEVVGTACAEDSRRIFSPIWRKVARQYRPKKKPRSVKIGTSRWSLLLSLVWCEVLPVAQVRDVLEHGRAWRKIRRIQEGAVERIITGWRVVDRGAAF